MANSVDFSETTGRLWERTPSPEVGGPILRLIPPTKHRFLCSVFSPANDWFALADSRGHVYQVQIAKNRFKTVARGCNGASAMAVIQREPDEVAVACGSNCIFVYQVTGRLSGTLKAHRTRVRHMSVNTARGMLLSCSEDACVLWSLGTWARVRSLFGEKNGFVSAEFAGNGRSVLTCFTRGEVYMWSLHDFQLEKQFAHSPGELFSSVIITSSFEYICAANTEGKLQIWEPENPSNPSFSLLLPSSKTVQLLPMSKSKVASLGLDGSLQISNLQTKEISTFPIPEPKAVSVSTQGSHLLVLDSSGSGRLFLLQELAISTNLRRGGLEKTTGKEAMITGNGEKTGDEEVEIMSEQERVALNQANPTDLRLKDLRDLLRKYGEFPDKYRLSIWQTILQLPQNDSAYISLAAKGIHPAYANLNEKYPIRSQKLFAQLQKMLSVLAHWSPIFAESDLIPAIVFPIVALAGEQEVLCFELIATLFLNWLQHWFEFFPNPPVPYLQSALSVLQRLDPDLSAHIRTLSPVPAQSLWPLFSNLMTEVLTKEEWVIMMDHLVMHWDSPDLLLHFLVQYILSYRTTILGIRNSDDFQHFLHKQNPAKVRNLMKKAKSVSQRPEVNKDVSVQFARRVPILKGGDYPLFTSYPQFEVQFQAQIRARIRQEAAETAKKQTYLEDLTNHLTDLEDKEKNYRAQQEALMQLDQDRRATAALSATAAIAEKRALDSEERNRRLNQLRKIQETIEKSLDSQVEGRRQELMKLEQEIEDRRKQDQYFLEKKMQDEAVARLEFQAAQKMYGLTRTREMEEEQRRLRGEVDSWKREQELRERLLHEQWTLEDEERRLKLESIKERKLKEMEALSLMNDRKKLEMQQQIQELEKEIRTQDVLRERKLRTVQEEEALRTAEALAQLTKAQTLIQQEEQMHFRSLLFDEKRLSERRAKERFELIELERRKQLQEMSTLDEEIKALEQRQQRIEVENRLAELRHEQEIKALGEERQLQEMLLRIDEERRVKSQLENEMKMKEEELKEKAEFQQVLRENEDRALSEERARFEAQREELRRQQEEEEAAKANAHNLKMETIIREREQQLLNLTQARRQPQFSRHEEMPIEEPHHRSLSPGEEGEEIVSRHDQAHREELRQVSSPERYTNRSYSSLSASSRGGSYSSEVSQTPPLPDRYESSSASEQSSKTGSITEESGLSWSRSESSPGREPVRRSHYY